MIFYVFFQLCIFFGLIFVIKGVPGGSVPSGGVPGCPGTCRLRPEGDRHPIVAWTPDPGIFITKTLFFDHASFT